MCTRSASTGVCKSLLTLLTPCTLFVMFVCCLSAFPFQLNIVEKLIKRLMDVTHNQVTHATCGPLFMSPTYVSPTSMWPTFMVPTLIHIGRHCE